MAISYVGSACVANASSTFQHATLPYAPVAGNTLVIGIYTGKDTVASDPATPSTVGATATWTQLASISNSYGWRGVFVAYNVPAGITAIKVDSANFSRMAITLAEFSGVSALDVGASAGMRFDQSFNTTVATDTISTTNADDLLVAFLHGNGSQTLSAPTNGFQFPTNQAEAGLSYRIVSATGSYNTAATLSGQDFWYSYIASFSAGGSGGGGTPVIVSRLGMLGCGQ